MTLTEMKLKLATIYVDFYRVNATSGKTWKEYTDNMDLQITAWGIWCRMNDKMYTIHIPRWLSHLGAFYAKKEHAGGNIRIYHKLKNDELVFIKSIPTYPFGDKP